MNKIKHSDYHFKNILSFSIKGLLGSLLKCCLIVCILFSFNFVNAESQKERIERMKAFVTVQENGDVSIEYDRKKPEMEISEKTAYHFAQLFLPLIYRIAPDMDYDKLAKAMSKEIMYPWWKVPPYLGNYLKKELQGKVKYVDEKKFNPRKMRELIDSGMPVMIEFGFFQKEEVNKTVQKRSNARKSLFTKEEFEENLKTNFVDVKREKIRKGLSHPSPLLAYNKFTKEFFIVGYDYWLTEEELLKLEVSVKYYELLP